MRTRRTTAPCRSTSPAGEQLLHEALGIDMLARPGRCDAFIESVKESPSLTLVEPVVLLAGRRIDGPKVHDLPLGQVGAGLVEDEATVVDVGFEGLHGVEVYFSVASLTMA